MKALKIQPILRTLLITVLVIADSVISTVSGQPDFILQKTRVIVKGNSSNEKCSVNGNIRSKKLIVTQAGWSDYVFDSCYRLKSLTELERFIKDNKRLPDVPSAKEVAKDGIDVGENQAVLLKKNEELTLYIIEVKKENIELNKKLEEVMIKISNIEKIVK